MLQTGAVMVHAYQQKGYYNVSKAVLEKLVKEFDNDKYRLMRYEKEITGRKKQPYRQS